VGLTGRRGLLPFLQALRTLLWCAVAQGLLQPVIKGPGRLAGGGTELAQVVIGEAAADDQHAFLTQRRQGTAHGDVGGRVTIALQGELQYRHIRLGVDHAQGDEGAMVESLLRIAGHRDPGVAQQLLYPCRHLG